MSEFNPFKMYKFEFDDEGYFQSCLVPLKLETCVCCGKRLTVACSGWGKEGEFWLPDEIELDCIRGMKCYKEFENSEYWRMPYVYWLPVEEHVKQWVRLMVKIYYGLKPVPQKWLEKNGQLRLALRDGMNSIGKIREL